MKWNNCIKFQKKAKTIIPGLTQLLSKRPDMFSLNVWPAYYKKANGVEIWDLDDNKYIDMSIGGIGANILGYCDTDVDMAVLDVIKNGSSSSLNGPEEIKLAELLCDIHPWASMVRYARTGGEAMAMAVRIARAYTGKDIVAFCGYHGWHDWYLAANLSNDSALDGHLLPGLSSAGVPRGLTGTAFPFSFNKIDELKNIVEKNRKNLAAIVIEPIRNLKPDSEFIEEVRNLANETKTVFIVDEISAGFRYSTGGAHSVFFPESCTPDIAVFSKGLGNGYPIAAIIGNSNVMQVVQKTFISSTYWTERIGPAAAIAMIKKHRAVNAGIHLVSLGEKMQQGWKKIALKNNLEITVSGMKPMSHFSFVDNKNQSMKAMFVQLMLQEGFLASNLFYSMYAHSEKNIDDYLKAADKAFYKISNSMKKGDIESQLIGEPSAVGFARLT